MELSADVLPSGDARVRVTYALGRGAAGDSLDATLLAFGDAVPEALETLTSEAGPRAVHAFTSGPGRRYTARLPVTPDPQGGSRLVVAYTVRSAVTREGGGLRVHVPVLSVDRPPEASGPGFFTARVSLPSAWAVSETFPTATTAGTEQTDPVVYRATLAVVPATLSFRAHDDGRWHPGLPLLLDLLTLVVLAGFAFVGVRHLRSNA